MGNAEPAKKAFLPHWKQPSAGPGLGYVHEAAVRSPTDFWSATGLLRIPESPFSWLSLIGISVPPRDPNNNNNEDEEDADRNEEDEEPRATGDQRTSEPVRAVLPRSDIVRPLQSRGILVWLTQQGRGSDHNSSNESAHPPK
jgi:hypothetical protein